MLSRYKPYIQSISVEAPLEDQKFYLKDLNHIHYAILDHKDRYYSLEETLPYIKITTELKKFSYTEDETGVKEHVDVKRTQLENCEAKHFDYS